MVFSDDNVMHSSVAYLIIAITEFERSGGWAKGI